MLRHSREMTRHNRERVINKKKNLFDSIWVGGWKAQTKNDLGRLSKHSTHHHHCHMCNDNRYDRARAKREERQYMGELPKGFDHH